MMKHILILIMSLSSIPVFAQVDYSEIIAPSPIPSPTPPKPKAEEPTEKKEEQKRGFHGGLIFESEAGIDFEIVNLAFNEINIYMANKTGKQLRPNLDIKFFRIHLSYFPTLSDVEYALKSLVVTHYYDHYTSIFELPAHTEGYDIIIDFYDVQSNKNVSIQMKIHRDPKIPFSRYVFPKTGR